MKKLLAALALVAALGALTGCASDTAGVSPRPTAAVTASPSATVSPSAAMPS